MSSAIGVFFRREFFEAYGFYSETSALASSNRNLEEEVGKINGLNIAGYFPGVGMGTAISRWAVAYNNWGRGRKDPDFEYNIGQIVRGILEFIGLGIVVGLLLDTTVSAFRHPLSCSRDSQQPEGVEHDIF